MMAKLTGPEELSLSDMLRASVRTQPDRTAVICGTERLTFQQLGERSEDTAVRLRQFGVAADELVGIFMEPSVDLMASVWGVLHAGCRVLAALARVSGRARALHGRQFRGQGHPDAGVTGRPAGHDGATGNRDPHPHP